MTEETLSSEDRRIIETIRPAIKPYEGKLFLKLSASERAVGKSVRARGSPLDRCDDGGTLCTRERHETGYFYSWHVSLASGVVGNLEEKANDGTNIRLLPTSEVFDWLNFGNGFGPYDMEERRARGWHGLVLDLNYLEQFKHESEIVLCNNGMLVRYKFPTELEKRKDAYGDIYLGRIGGHFRNDMSAFIFGEDAIAKVLDLERYVAHCERSGSKFAGIHNTAELYQAVLVSAYFKQLSELMDNKDPENAMLWQAAENNASQLFEKWKQFTNEKSEYCRKSEEHERNRKERRKGRMEREDASSYSMEDRPYHLIVRFKCDIHLDPKEKEIAERIDATLQKRVDDYFRSGEAKMFGIKREHSFMNGLPQV